MPKYNFFKLILVPLFTIKLIYYDMFHLIIQYLLINCGSVYKSKL